MTTHFLEPNPSQCKTCIFRAPHDGGLELPPERLAEITEYLCWGNQHICHTNPDRVCRGGRDLQLQVFAALGMIDEATDEALEAANQAYLASKEESDEDAHAIRTQQVN
ncbi:MAG: hypothetical protein HC768_16665 [Acaryochloris sp. CRU_2_0]|nr:hypothetical protein [Acaryochloris sp. CRU_2_0]